jgi:drug/metabolite transporter (DMT)-like permease
MKWLYVAIIVLATTGSDMLLTLRMKQHGEIHDFSPGPLGRALAALVRSWHVILAVVLMAVSFFAFLSLLSIADLTFAVPATAATYVLETVLAKYLLKERVNWKRWTGAGLVACGVALIAS